MFEIRRVTPNLKKEWISSLENYLETYDFFKENIIEDVETKIKNFTGRRYALCVNSGSNAIFMCLYLFKNKGNEVIIPNYGYPSAFKSCKILGITPIPVDIKYDSLSIDPKKLIEVITNRTSTVVHIGNNGVIGHDINEIKVILLLLQTFVG
jgi:dTDP-4-amino-4,6-dideoxygalactose transaminase